MRCEPRLTLGAFCYDVGNPPVRFGGTFFGKATMDNGITVMEIKGGWMARSANPRLAASGRTPFHAQLALEEILRIHWAALEPPCESRPASR